MPNERTVKVALLGEDRSLSKTFANAEKSAGSFDRKMADTGEKLRSVGAKMTLALTLPLGLLAKSAFDAASDTAESMSKVDVVFGRSAQKIKDFAKTAATQLGISNQKALEAAGTFGSLFRAMGLGEEVAAQMSGKLVKLASDMASFSNKTPEEALEALRSGITGESEPLKVFGVMLNEARIKAEALTLGLVKGKEELSASAKAQAIFSLIMKDTAIQQGDFARTADGAANQTRILAARFDDAKAKIGEVFLPIGLRLLEWANNLLETFLALPEPLQNLIIGFGGAAAAIGPVTTALGAIAGVIGAISAPVAIVVGAILAIGGALLYVSGLWPEFNSKVDGAIQWIKDKWPAVKDKILEVWNAAVDWLKNEGLEKLKEAGAALAGAVGGWFSDLWEGTEGNPGWKDKFDTAIESMGKWVEEEVPELEKKFEPWGDAAVKWISESAPRIPEEFDKFMVKLDEWVTAEGVEEAIKQGARMTYAFMEGMGYALVAISVWGIKLSFALGVALLRVAGSVWYHGWSIGLKIIEGIQNAIRSFLGDIGNKILEALRIAVNHIAPEVREIFSSLIGNGISGLPVIGPLFGNASGGLIPAGWSMVGERGPELVHRSGSTARVFGNNSPTTQGALRDDGASAPIIDVVVYVGGEQVEAQVTSRQRTDARGRR